MDFPFGLGTGFAQRRQKQSAILNSPSFQAWAWGLGLAKNLDPLPDPREVPWAYPFGLPVKESEVASPMED